MIFLETHRLYLRNVIPSDVDVMFDYRNCETCARFQRGQTRDYAGIEQLIQRHQDEEISTEKPFVLAIALKDTNEMVGEIVVMPSEKTFTLGYTVSHPYHRRGYAFEALTSLIVLLHGRYPDWEFISFTHPKNHASMSLLTKLGYQNLGYVSSKGSQAFGKWVTQSTKEEFAQISS